MKRLIFLPMLIGFFVLAQTPIKTYRLTADTVKHTLINQLPTHPTNGFKDAWWQRGWWVTDSMEHYRVITTRDSLLLKGGDVYKDSANVFTQGQEINFISADTAAIILYKDYYVGTGTVNDLRGLQQGLYFEKSDGVYAITQEVIADSVGTAKGIYNYLFFDKGVNVRAQENESHITVEVDQFYNTKNYVEINKAREIVGTEIDIVVNDTVGTVVAYNSVIEANKANKTIGYATGLVTGPATTQENYSFFASSPIGTINKNYGLYMEDQSVGVDSSFSIYSRGGNAYFRDTVDMGALKIKGVLVDSLGGVAMYKDLNTAVQWDSTATYQVGDFVWYYDTEGTNYLLCKTAHTPSGGNPFLDNSKWILISYITNPVYDFNDAGTDTTNWDGNDENGATMKAVFQFLKTNTLQGGGVVDTTGTPTANHLANFVNANHIANSIIKVSGPDTFFISSYKGALSYGNNIFIGDGGQSSTTDISDSEQTGSSNTSIGRYSLFNNTKGFANSSVGAFSLYSNTDGYRNTGIGLLSLFSNKTGVHNVAIGSDALYYSLSNENTSIGTQSSYNIRGGQYNTSIGYTAGGDYRSGSFNVMVGYNSGYIVLGTAADTIINRSIFIGSGTATILSNQTNQIVIGDTTTGHGSNTATWGNKSITDHYFKGKLNLNEQPLTIIRDTAISITADSIMVLYSQGQTLINAPGSGKAIEVLSCSYKWTYTSDAYDSKSQFIYIGNELNDPNTAQFSLGVPYTNTSSSMNKCAPYVTATDVMKDNHAVLVSTSTDDPVNGTSTMKIYITYRIITL